MSKPLKRWRIWKIAVATGGCAGVAAGLFWLASVLERIGSKNPEGNGEPAVLTVPTLVFMMGVALGLLSIVSLGWLVWRIYDARIPAWEKGKKRKWR